MSPEYDDGYDDGFEASRAETADLRAAILVAAKAFIAEPTMDNACALVAILSETDGDQPDLFGGEA